MAYEIMQLFTRTDAQSRKIVVMAGHEAGILTFGKDLEEAFAVLVRERERHYRVNRFCARRRNSRDQAESTWPPLTAICVDVR